MEFAKAFRHCALRQPRLRCRRMTAGRAL